MMEAGYWHLMKPVLVSICCYGDATLIAKAFREFFPLDKVEVTKAGDDANFYLVDVKDGPADDESDDETDEEVDEGEYQDADGREGGVDEEGGKKLDWG